MKTTILNEDAASISSNEVSLPLFVIYNSSWSSITSDHLVCWRDLDTRFLILVNCLIQFRPFSSSNPFLATVTLNQELFRGTDQSCRLLELSLSGSGIKYTAGDHVAVFPQNSKELVERLCDLLQVDPEQHIHIISGLDSRRRRWNRFPTPCTFRTAFAHYLDLTTPPRFDLIEALVHYAQSESERLFLRKLTQTHLGDNTYEKWILATRRNVVELLENLPSCRPPAELLCRLLPRLQVRYYSAASSSRCQPDRLRLIVKVVKYTSLSGRLHEGVASSLLSGLQPRDRVPVFLQRSEFRLPRSPMTPIIMVATGTGLAPFLGFIQERKFIKSKGGKLGEAVLFYGCRTRREDYILADELQDALDQGVISGLHTAFSRETTHKVYVQHLMHQLADAIWSLLKTKNGHFYVCGDPRRTARGVRDALLDIIQQKGSLNSTEASEFLEQLKSARRCIFDTWT